MSDIDKLKKLLKEFEVGFTEETHEGKTILRCFEGNKNITGYSSFFTDFDFDKEGKFLEIGAWE